MVECGGGRERRDRKYSCWGGFITKERRFFSISDLPKFESLGNGHVELLSVEEATAAEKSRQKSSRPQSSPRPAREENEPIHRRFVDASCTFGEAE